MTFCVAGFADHGAMSPVFQPVSSWLFWAAISCPGITMAPWPGANEPRAWARKVKLEHRGGGRGGGGGGGGGGRGGGHVWQSVTAGASLSTTTIHGPLGTPYGPSQMMLGKHACPVSTRGWAIQANSGAFLSVFGCRPKQRHGRRAVTDEGTSSHDWCGHALLCIH